MKSVKIAAFAVTLLASTTAFASPQYDNDGKVVFAGSGSYSQSAYKEQITRTQKGRKTRQRVDNSTQTAGFGGFGGAGIVEEARRYIGGNPTGRSSLWCATFMNMVLERTGRKGTGSNMASSFASYGTRVSGPQVGAIAVMSRGRRGGHVGVVSGIDSNGNPIIISGNHGRRVAESTYSRGRIYAYVLP
jgi:uncharacterized protein (TIGR02594 family)